MSTKVNKRSTNRHYAVALNIRVKRKKNAIPTIENKVIHKLFCYPQIRKYNLLHIPNQSTISTQSLLAIVAVQLSMLCVMYSKQRVVCVYYACKKRRRKKKKKQEAINYIVDDTSRIQSHQRKTLHREYRQRDVRTRLNTQQGTNK